MSTQISWMLLLFGRVLLGGLFVLGGLRHFFALDPLTQVIRARGVPMPRLAIIGGLLIAAARASAMGKRDVDGNPRLLSRQASRYGRAYANLQGTGISTLIRATTLFARRQARLSDDLVLVVKRRTSYDRNEPPQFEWAEGLLDHRPSVDLGVEFWGSSLATFAWASQDHDHKARLDLDFVRVAERHSDRELWRCSFHREGEREIMGSRVDEDEPTFSSAPLTPQERRLLRCATPRFGEYAELVEQILTLIRHASSWVDTQKGADLAEYLKSSGDSWRAGRDSNP